MTENQKYLKAARARAEEFETQLEPERLREAYMALENVSLSQEHDTRARAQLRTETLSLWLRLLRLLDRFLDPNFNPADVPAKLVEPPPVPGGIVLRPGADPALIDDPVARAEYEKAIAANREKARYYRFQIGLRRLSDGLPQRVENYIRNNYARVPPDQEELKAAVEAEIKDARRKERLLKLLEPATNP